MSRGLALSAGIALVLGAGCGQSLRDAEGDVAANSLLGRTGGRIDISEAHLEVPSGAVDSDILITVRRNSAAPAAIGATFAFQPVDHVFSRPLVLTIDLPQPLPPPLTIDRVGLAGLSGPIWRRIAGSTVNGTTQVTATVTQLATFAVVLTCSSNGDCDSGSCDTGACQVAP